MVLEYKPLKIGTRTLKVRNWKVRDRLKLKEYLSQNPNELKQQEFTLETLVYNCLETPAALNEDELEYLFTQLRINSIGDDVDFKFTCSNPDCNETVDVKLKVSKIYKPNFTELKDIRIGENVIELQEIKNVEYYNRKMKESKSPSFTDLVLHIKTLNGETLSEQAILKKFEDLDTKEMDEILDKWDSMRFTISRENELKCPHCGKTETFIFDEIPNLIPQKWFKR